MSFRRFSGRGIGGVLLRRQEQYLPPITGRNTGLEAAEKVEQFRVGIPVDREESQHIHKQFKLVYIFVFVLWSVAQNLLFLCMYCTEEVLRYAPEDGNCIRW